MPDFGLESLKQNSIMINEDYGTPRYYAEMFADIAADIQKDNPEYGDSLIKGFKIALEEWKEYYQGQVEELDRVISKANEEI
jgi:hypothetical protein